MIGAYVGKILCQLPIPTGRIGLFRAKMYGLGYAVG